MAWGISIKRFLFASLKNKVDFLGAPHSTCAPGVAYFFLLSFKVGELGLRCKIQSWPFRRIKGGKGCMNIHEKNYVGCASRHGWNTLEFHAYLIGSLGNLPHYTTHWKKEHTLHIIMKSFYFGPRLP